MDSGSKGQVEGSMKTTQGTQPRGDSGATAEAKSATVASGKRWHGARTKAGLSTWETRAVGSWARRSSSLVVAHTAKVKQL